MTDRRGFLHVVGLGGAFVGGGLVLSACGSDGDSTNSEGLRDVTLQANFLVNVSQLGEVTAIEQGFYQDEGLNVSITPGGPSVDPTSSVVGGHTDIGVGNSSPSIFLGVSEGRPIKAFTVAAQTHPYGFFSLPDNPVRTPADIVGKKVGVNQTGVILLEALLAENGYKKSDVDIVTTSGEITPLLTGQVDVWTGWVIQQGQLKELPEDYVTMTLAEAGVPLYALIYFATEKSLKEDREMLEAFTRASARGWFYARENTEEAVKALASRYDSLNEEDEAVAAEKILDFVFPDGSDEFGEMDPKLWEEQMDIYDRLGLFDNPRPSVDKVMTSEILEATKDARMGDT
ncbi:ABC transporter substrate-binding protein [Janibacter cremeus]|uniref:Thiamine pyrimidine synthase n=1 Tax=Janibacter cremeus TaxID=1285192 RepID=A0A852VT05_9MICO|nr:ABC transporter substrate-binding protein [Janibacter cremeus]NYF97444.1 NitT/TauT family transport system substrate-binding protein [Janibacter cremeus]